MANSSWGPETHRILSQPFPVRWEGWESDTEQLQRCGWEIAAEEDPSRACLRIALHHPMMRLYGLSDMLHLDNYISSNSGAYRGRPPLIIQHVAPTIMIREVAEMNLTSNWRAIDATPRMIEHRVRSLEDMYLFAGCQNRAEEVFVEGADMSVVDHLQAILEQQAEKQKDLRAQSRRSERHTSRDSELIMSVVKVA